MVMTHCRIVLGIVCLWGFLLSSCATIPELKVDYQIPDRTSVLAGVEATVAPAAAI